MSDLSILLFHPFYFGSVIIKISILDYPRLNQVNLCFKFYLMPPRFNGKSGRYNMVSEHRIQPPDLGRLGRSYPRA